MRSTWLRAGFQFPCISLFNWYHHSTYSQHNPHNNLERSSSITLLLQMRLRLAPSITHSHIVSKRQRKSMLLAIKKLDREVQICLKNIGKPLFPGRKSQNCRTLVLMLQKLWSRTGNCFASDHTGAEAMLFVLTLPSPHPTLNPPSLLHYDLQQSLY